MTFSRVNPLGWALYEVLTSAQMNALDLNASRAIDGDQGGTYNPANPININGTLNVTNLSGSMGGSAVFTTLQVTSTSQFDGSVAFNAGAYVNSGNFTFQSTGDLNVSHGRLRVYTVATAEFLTTTTFEGTVNSTADWNYSAGALIYSGTAAVTAGGAWTFTNNPTFTNGLRLANNKEIYYSTTRTWTILFPFAIGGGPMNESGTTEHDAYRFNDVEGYWFQKDNTTYPVPLWCFPQGLWGETPISITNFKVNVEPVGSLSGTPSGDTYAAIYSKDKTFDSGNSIIAYDTTPNVANDHQMVPTGTPTPITYNPSTNVLYIGFFGYAGGDTLNGSTKYYSIKSVELTVTTNSKGVY